MNTISRRQDRWSKIKPLATFLKDWPLYLFEASELAIFMILACVFTVLLFHPGYRRFDYFQILP